MFLFDGYLMDDEEARNIVGIIWDIFRTFIRHIGHLRDLRDYCAISQWGHKGVKRDMIGRGIKGGGTGGGVGSKLA